VDVSVFDVFDLTTYTFYVLNRGGVTGNTIDSSYSATGVFKLRSDLVRNPNSETKESNATLHIRPEESFLSGLDGNLVGHGVHVMNKDYEIVGQTGGKNFHDGVMEHYTATLQESDFSDWGSSS
jgi:hypothetical protein